MLKELLYKIENYLWLVPAIAGYIFSILFNENYCNVILFGDNFLISHLEATLYWILILMIPYLMHYTLRGFHLGNPVFKAIHVVGTLVIIVAFPFLYYSSPMIIDQWHRVTVPPPMFDKWETISIYADSMWVIVILLQVFFMIYGITLVLWNRVRN